MAKRRQEDEDAERLGAMIAVATVATYVSLYPRHDAGPLLEAMPELKVQGDRYYQSIARRLIAAGWTCPKGK